MNRSCAVLILATFVGAAAACAQAQAVRTPVAAPAGRPAPVRSPAVAAQTPPAAPVSAEPETTTASFGDWLLRCTRPANAARVCEVAEGIRNQDRAVAELAFGRAARGQPMQFTILVPTDATVASEPSLGSARDGDAPMATLAWRRCTPGGCVADAALSDDVLQRISALTQPARVTFVDAAGRSVALPFSPRGLAQALAALANESAG